MCCACDVLGRFAPVHRCACWVCAVACALSLATWLLFTGVHAQCHVFAVSLTTWLPFTGVPARCVVLCVRCPWPLGSCSPVCTLDVLPVPCRWPLGTCSPVCTLGVLCCGCGVLAHLALTGVHVTRVLCGVLRRVVLLCVCCGSALRPTWSRALRSFFLWCVFLGWAVVPWHLVPAMVVAGGTASLACLVAPRCCAMPRSVQ